MKRLTFLIFILFFSCEKHWWEEIRFIQAPNWTPENKILFLEEVWKTKHFKDIWGGAGIDEMISEIYLWEVDTLQNYKKLGLLFKIEGRYVGFSYLSCAGDWILISGDTDTNIYAINRNTLEKRYLGKGMYADLSPDGKKFVYVKPNKGLWIKNIDGTNDHQIIDDPNANHPAWSPDGGRIGYNFGYEKCVIIDTNGNFIDSFNARLISDWGPSDSNALLATILKLDRGVIIYLSNYNEDTLSFAPWSWSPSGNLFLTFKSIYKRDGTKLFTIKP